MNEVQLYLTTNIKRITDNKKKVYLTENNDFIYRTKLEECKTFALALSPSDVENGHNLEDYPFIKAEKEEYNDSDTTTTINRILNAYNLSTEKLSQIERYRRRALLQECNTFSQADNILSELEQNLSLL